MSIVTLAKALDIAQRHLAAGELNQAELAYRKVLAHTPEQPNALYGLGLIAYQVGQRDVAADLIGQAARLAPSDLWLSNLCFILRELGRMEDAVAAGSDAVRINSHSHEAQNNFGFALLGAGRLDHAIAAFSAAIRLKPDWSLPLANLAWAQRLQNRFADAIKTQLRVVELAGANAVTLSDLGVLLHANNQLDDAAAAFRKSIALQPMVPEVHNNLGNVLQDSGRLDDALACFREALRLRPDFAVAHSNLLYAMHFDPACDPAKLLDAHREWARQHAKPLTAAAPVHTFKGPLDRRLRVGYVSHDLFDHPVGRFLAEVIEQHDHDRFEITCYSGGTSTDAVNHRLRAASDAWHDVTRLSDAQLADLIRGHEVDILFDLTVHAPGNRLLVFARKPAPIQVSYLGYPGTTGMSAMDYRITDPFLDPPGTSEIFYTEQSLRPAPNYWCYAPIPSTPDVGKLPASRNDCITFGCLNHFGKTNPALLNTWSRILAQVPNSKMILHAHAGQHRDDVLSMLRANGVDPVRMEFVRSQVMQEYLETYNRIDIALDPFPYHGGTTTCDALWMGVPVVSLAGLLAVHRAGVTLLNNIGSPEWVAHSVDQYVTIACDLAGDFQRLAEIRRTLRDRMRRSPLCDPKHFTRGLERALVQAWQQFAADQTVSRCSSSTA